MPRTRDPNPITSGAIGALGGAVIGGATSVLLTNKSARDKIASRLKDIRGYAKEAITSVGDMADQNQLRRVKFAGVKGGKTKKRGRRSRY